LIRAEREKRDIGLREFAARVKKSPAFMVRLETDEVVPAVAEQTLVTIADALGLDGDLVLALARKVPKDLKPDDELDLALYRKVKSMSPEEKRRFLEGGRGGKVGKE
jgi:transcriptional regulator with XRE-family HTH domain